ncbi:MAG: hypothetical protein Q9M22_04200 [Mariprofundaceae bacterium]|nr:hypothetical protein [Mariprofundaceae bacterium]
MAASMACMAFADNNLPSWWRDTPPNRQRRLLASTQNGVSITVDQRQLYNFS